MRPPHAVGGRSGFPLPAAIVIVIRRSATKFAVEIRVTIDAQTSYYYSLLPTLNCCPSRNRGQEGIRQRPARRHGRPARRDDCAIVGSNMLDYSMK